MKIYIHREKYINNPCPKITKEMWNWFYRTLFLSFRNRSNVKKIETMHIRINQAFKGCSKIHFYVTINKGLNDEFDFHKEWTGHDYDGIYHKKRYKWVVDFIELGGIDMGTTKPIECYKREIETRKLKEKSRKSVYWLVKNYNSYVKLKEDFGHYKIYEDEELSN